MNKNKIIQKFIQFQPDIEKAISSTTDAKFKTRNLLSFLNKLFKDNHIQFKQTIFNKNKDCTLGGYTTMQNVIVVEVCNNFYSVFDAWDEFLKDLFIIIQHESIHVLQNIKSGGMSKSTNDKNYMEYPEEISAYANETIHDFLIHDYTKQDIIQMLKADVYPYETKIDDYLKLGKSKLTNQLKKKMVYYLNTIREG